MFDNFLTVVRCITLLSLSFYLVHLFPDNSKLTFYFALSIYVLAAMLTGKALTGLIINYVKLCRQHKN